MGPPFYNRVMVPIGLGLIFLTGVGPLLAWRSTSLRAIRRNLLLPCSAILLTAIILIATGLRPWAEDDPTSSIYALVCLSLSAGVLVAIVSEFLRGAGVLRTQTGKNLASSALLLTRRNTRRYGGYLIHFGIVVMFIGLAGAAFNQSREMEMGFGDSLSIGSWKIVCNSYSQDSNGNYDTDYALLDLYHGNKKVTQLTPERRVYFPDTDHAQASTVVAIHSTLARDLYVVFEGRDRQTDKPTIKVFLNPLVNWIWIGVGIVIFGTAIALVPSLKPGSQRVEARATRRWPVISTGAQRSGETRSRSRTILHRGHSCLSASSNSRSSSSPPSPCSAQAHRPRASTTSVTSSCAPAAAPRSSSSATTSAALTPPA